MGSSSGYVCLSDGEIAPQKKNLACTVYLSINLSLFNYQSKSTKLDKTSISNISLVIVRASDKGVQIVAKNEWFYEGYGGETTR